MLAVRNNELALSLNVYIYYITNNAWGIEDILECELRDPSVASESMSRTLEFIELEVLSCSTPLYF